MNKTRNGDVLLSKFLTNMLPTNKLLHRFNIVSSPNCDFCVHAEETISHILFHCPRYRDPRLQLLKEIQNLNLRLLLLNCLLRYIPPKPVTFGQECQGQAESA
ncbi:hypothetical protein AVEN_169737-1 [Araneus ventricosus]|uniref:Reverse transcriptase zinc-binding domain-containing protein n=1 Tax=Araneus ventricosus TaxID=182803 RepID=A0A4Y2KSK6_ARAVE|nr:hypothetical protein AVEN_169737-1 [Araneus ventricosus]